MLAAAVSCLPARSGSDAAKQEPLATTPQGPELPRGGRTLFPSYELVGFCGNHPAKANKLEGYAAKSPRARPILPVFELIAVVVQAGPGADGKYRRRVDDSVVDDYLRLARQHQGLLLLNIQPGQLDFLTELQHFEKFLRE